MFRVPDGRRAFGALLLTYALDYFGYLLVLPLFPTLLFDPQASVLPVETAQHVRILWAGGLLALFGVAQLIASPLLGVAVDRWGCRRVLLMTIAGCMVGYLVLAVAVVSHSLGLLALGRFWTGLSSGNGSLVQAGVGSLALPEQRGKAYGYLFGVGAISIMVGPLVGGLAPPVWAFLISASVSALGLIIVGANLRDVGHLETFKGIGSLLRRPGMVALLATFFAFLMGRGGYSLFFSTFLLHRFNLGPSFIGEIYALMGLSYVLTGILLNPRLVNRFAGRRIAMLGAALNGIGALASAAAPAAWWFLFIAPLCALGASMAQANFSAMISQRVPDSCQGRVFGLVGVLWSVAQAIGPLLVAFVGSLSMTFPLALCGLFYLTAAAGAAKLRAAPEALEV